MGETELKTLKDLTWKNVINGEISINEKTPVGVEELRQEAIKWIKVLDKKIIHYPNMPECPYCGMNFNDKANVGAKYQKFILMEFFNLTEEDLK